ncbi:MAG: recombination mediator RecR [Planctomycetota bacterium]
MATQSESIEQLTAEFARMPGIGKRTATRLAFHVQSISKEDAGRLVDAIRAVKAKSLTCSHCFNVSETDPCPVCSAGGRDRSMICVVERVRDLAAIEASGSYRGLYHVLGGRIAPLDGVYPENLTISRLVRRIKKGDVKEVIIATNPDTEGDSTAHHLMQELAPLGVTVSALARGMPVGGQVEHAGKNTLTGAIKGRQRIQN